MAITLEPGQVKQVNVQMIPLPAEPATLIVSVTAVGAPGIGIQRAHVQIDGTGGPYEGWTGPTGMCEITDIEPGVYDGVVTHPDYEPAYF